MELNVAEIIAKKRDGHDLVSNEVAFIIEQFHSGRLPDYQMSALAMAIVCRGMSQSETVCLTEAMLSSGDSLPRGDRPRVDKHSTGGLGDKVSLVLAPLLACCDLDVPMLSGRGLGITGGTLDKLEAYQGLRTDLSIEEIGRQVNELGCVITGTTATIAPADKKLYALRDVTATVPSDALITSSILSKKLAANLDALVLDVKCGSGAFMKSFDAAAALSERLQATAKQLGLPTATLITDMSQPLGNMIGNACEANEAVQVLKGGGPLEVWDICLGLARQLFEQLQPNTSVEELAKQFSEARSDGSGLQKYIHMIESQGGRFEENLALSPERACVAPRGGWLAAIDCQKLGSVMISLGGGRKQQGDAIDHRVGLRMHVRIGDRIEKGQPIVTVFSSQRDFDSIKHEVMASISISEVTVPAIPLFLTAVPNV